MGTGFLQVIVTVASYAVPISGASVTVSQGGRVLYRLATGADGTTDSAAIEAPDRSVTLDPNHTGDYYSRCDVRVEAEGFTTKNIYDVMILDTETTLLPVNMTPVEARDDIGEPDPVSRPDDEVALPNHSLVEGDVNTSDHADFPPSRLRILPEVVIPHYITVHLGRPGTDATNVTVEFKYYIKNVCSHEIFATWPEAAIEANIYCQISLALNRIYTEWYRSKGYSFDITSSTYNDQNFVYQGEIFPNIAAIVDRVFNRYVRRIGHKEPYYTEYCDGVKADCPGLKQWGTVTLADQGYSPIQILQYYYGNDIEIAESDNIADVDASYPGYVLREGMSGAAVRDLQNYLNRIRVAYPGIPQITNPDGYFGPETAAAVKAFKESANWPNTGSASSGAVDKATWYNISYAYYAIKKLGELGSEGEVIGVGRTPPASVISEGSRGTPVGMLQYLLNVISDFYPEVPPVVQDYDFGRSTTDAVKDFQKAFNLSQDGIVGPGTWRKLYEIYWAIRDSNLLGSPNEPPAGGGGLPAYPGSLLTVGSSGASVRQLQQCLNNISDSYPAIGKLTADGVFGNAMRNAVIAFQNIFGLAADGVVGPGTWARVSAECAGSSAETPSYPGYPLRNGSSGDAVLQIQSCLNSVAARYPSIPRLTEDGRFGNGTEDAVIVFQQLFNMTADGIVGPSTWAKMMAECQAAGGTAPAYPGYLIGAGSSGDYVRQIQRCLNNAAAAYPSIPLLTEDGSFGSGTRNAVIAFQRAVGLPQDGIVGAATWNRLMQECSAYSRAMREGQPGGYAYSDAASMADGGENGAGWECMGGVPSRKGAAGTGNALAQYLMLCLMQRSMYGR